MKQPLEQGTDSSQDGVARTMFWIAAVWSIGDMPAAAASCASLARLRAFAATTTSRKSRRFPTELGGPGSSFRFFALACSHMDCADVVYRQGTAWQLELAHAQFEQRAAVCACARA